MNLVDIPLQHAHYKTQSDNWSVALFYCISGQFIFWSFVYSLSSWMELVFGHFIDAWNDLPLYNYWLVPTIIIIVLCKIFKQSIHYDLSDQVKYTTTMYTSYMSFMQSCLVDPLSRVEACTNFAAVD